MRLIKLLILVFSTLFIEQSANAQKTNSYKLINGFIIYNVDTSAGYATNAVPHNIIFIPSNIDSKLNLVQNIEKNLRKKKYLEGYNLYFIQMGHTQYYIQRSMDRGELTIDTSRYIVNDNLKKSLDKSSKQDAYSMDYPDVIPSFPPINCKLKICMGAIVFDQRDHILELIRQSEFTSQEKNLKTFTLILNKHKKKVAYTQTSYSFNLGQNLYFMPLKLSQ